MIDGMFIPKKPVRGSMNPTLSMNSSSFQSDLAALSACTVWQSAIKSGRQRKGVNFNDLMSQSVNVHKK